VEIGGFAPFSRVGTGYAKLLAWRRINRTPDTGSKTMTFNFANAQQLAVSVLGALLAASLFVSAAVGPAGQLI